MDKEALPLLAAIVGVLPFLFTLASDRSGRGQRRRALAELKLRIEVVEAWLRSRTIAGEEHERDGANLQHARHDLDVLLAGYHELVQSEDDISFAARSLLLFRPVGLPALLVHVSFYVAAVYVGIVLAFFVSVALEGPRDIQYLLFNAATFVGMALLVRALQKLALNAHKETARDPQATTADVSMT